MLNLGQSNRKFFKRRHKDRNTSGMMNNLDERQQTSLGEDEANQEENENDLIEDTAEAAGHDSTNTEAPNLTSTCPPINELESQSPTDLKTHEQISPNEQHATASSLVSNSETKPLETLDTSCDDTTKSAKTSPEKTQATPQTIDKSKSPESKSDSDEGEKTPAPAPQCSPRRRVKLYALNSDRHWDDRGTGHVTVVTRTEKSEPPKKPTIDEVSTTPETPGDAYLALLVKEENDGSNLLDSRIRLDTAYQRQQETLIVWSENGADLALSFQEKLGCEEIWARICDVQGKDPSVEVTQDCLDEDDDESQSGLGHINEGSGSTSTNNTLSASNLNSMNSALTLPPIELQHLDDIQELVTGAMITPLQRERLGLALEQDQHLRKLLGLFHQCEESGNVDHLFSLHSILKQALMLNRNNIYETLFSEEHIDDVIGALEYDPGTKIEERKRHREIVKSQAKFREVVPIVNNELRSKIVQTYKVQYINDVVLPTPTVFEDNLLSALTSFLFFNKVEIVSLIQDNDDMMTQIFTPLCDPNTSPAKRKDSFAFLKEYCSFSHTLQQTARDTFFRKLVFGGVLKAIEVSIRAVRDYSVRSLIMEVLSYIVEYGPSLVRDYVLRQMNWNSINTVPNLSSFGTRTSSKSSHESLHDAESDTHADDAPCKQDDIFLNVIIQEIVRTKAEEVDINLTTILMGLLRFLLDPENMNLSSGSLSSNKSEKTEFLAFFYRHCMSSLIAPILNQPVLDSPKAGSMLTPNKPSKVFTSQTTTIHKTAGVPTERKSWKIASSKPGNRTPPPEKPDFSLCGSSAEKRKLSESNDEMESCTGVSNSVSGDTQPASSSPSIKPVDANQEDDDGFTVPRTTPNAKRFALATGEKDSVPSPSQPGGSASRVNGKKASSFAFAGSENNARFTRNARLVGPTGCDSSTVADLESAQLMSQIIELLSFCVEHHTFHIKNYIISRNLLGRILPLVRSRHMFLACTAVRFLRKMVGLNNDFYNRYIIRTDLMRPIFERFVDNADRYNMLNSAILELCEHIKSEDVRLLGFYIVEKYFDSLKCLQFKNTFEEMRQKFEKPAGDVDDSDEDDTGGDEETSDLEEGDLENDEDDEEEDSNVTEEDDDNDSSGALSSEESSTAETGLSPLVPALNVSPPPEMMDTGPDNIIIRSRNGVIAPSGVDRVEQLLLPVHGNLGATASFDADEDEIIRNDSEAAFANEKMSVAGVKEDELAEQHDALTNGATEKEAAFESSSQSPSVLKNLPAIRLENAPQADADDKNCDNKDTSTIDNNGEATLLCTSSGKQADEV